MTGFCSGVSGTEDTNSESSSSLDSEVDPESESPPHPSAEEQCSSLFSSTDRDSCWDSAAQQLVRKPVYGMFITNNRASFHLWLKESLVKPQKVSKYYENDCSY